MRRPTPIGRRSVAVRVREEAAVFSWVARSPMSLVEPMRPRPPALETAAARAPPAKPPICPSGKSLSLIGSRRSNGRGSLGELDIDEEGR